MKNEISTSKLEECIIDFYIFLNKKIVKFYIIQEIKKLKSFKKQL